MGSGASFLPHKGRMRPPRAAPGVNAGFVRRASGRDGAGGSGAAAPTATPLQPGLLLQRGVKSRGSGGVRGHGEGPCPADPGELGLLFAAVAGVGLGLVLIRAWGGDAPNPWEVQDPSVSLKRKHGKQLSWESSAGGKGIVGNCSFGSPTEALCSVQGQSCSSCKLLWLSAEEWPLERRVSVRGRTLQSTCSPYLLGQSFLWVLSPPLTCAGVLL